MYLVFFFLFNVIRQHPHLPTATCNDTLKRRPRGAFIVNNNKNNYNDNGNDIQSAVVSTISSKDGLKLAVGTAAGSIGVLDVMTHGYTTALRSHRGGVIAVAVDPSDKRDEFATVSGDCTIRYSICRKKEGKKTFSKKRELSRAL